MIALVTGASRGLGKGIALALGAQGATVYVTGRSRVGASTLPLGGSVDETAAAVTNTGGVGVAIECDHTDDGAVIAALETVFAAAGHVDVCVHAAWAGYEERHVDAAANDVWAREFWNVPLAMWDACFDAGVRGAYVTASLAARHMVPARSGLIVLLSSKAGGGLVEGNNVAYCVAHATVERLAALTAVQLRPHGVHVIALRPGLVRTEGVMQYAQWLDLSVSESTQYTGRVVAALAGDPHVAARTGATFDVAELAEAYGVVDVDGRRPAPLAVSYLE